MNFLSVSGYCLWVQWLSLSGITCQCEGTVSEYNNSHCHELTLSVRLLSLSTITDMSWIDSQCQVTVSEYNNRHVMNWLSVSGYCLWVQWQSFSWIDCQCQGTVSEYNKCHWHELPVSVRVLSLSTINVIDMNCLSVSGHCLWVQ
jgi:hypothetical protein